MSQDRQKWLDNEWRETDRLKRKATRLGIDIPKTSEWWWNDSEINKEAGVSPQELELVTRYYLSEEAKARLEFLFEEAEDKKEDARLDRRYKRLAFYVQIVTMIGTLGGIAMGIILALKQK